MIRAFLLIGLFYAITPLARAELVEVQGPSPILYGRQYQAKASLEDPCKGGGETREYFETLTTNKVIELQCQAIYGALSELERIGIDQVAGVSPRSFAIDSPPAPHGVFKDGNARLYALPYGTYLRPSAGLFALHTYRCKVSNVPQCSEGLLRDLARRAKLPKTIEISLDVITGGDPGLIQGGGGGSGGYPSNTPSSNGSSQ